MFPATVLARDTLGFPSWQPGASLDCRRGELTLYWGENEVSPEDLSWALHMLA